MYTIRVKQFPVCCMVEAFDSSSWSIFLYAVRDGKATTTYDYTIAGQLASLTTRNLELKTDSSESFLWDGLALIRRGGVNYLNEPHAGGGAALLAGEHQKSAKPKPVAWGNRDFDAVRRHGARSGRPRRSGNVMFNDVLGTTLSVEGEGGTFSTARGSAYGEADSTDHFFTGKPYVEGLGHAFLLRNYRADLGEQKSVKGKHLRSPTAILKPMCDLTHMGARVGIPGRSGNGQTADPLGHPDGWNNFAYCNGRVTSAVDLYGAEMNIIGSLSDALDQYAWWGGVPAKIAENVILSCQSTTEFANQINSVLALLAGVSHDSQSGTVSYKGSFAWKELTYVLGRNVMNFSASFVDWVASPWVRVNGHYERTVTGIGDILLHTTDNWNFTPHGDAGFWDNLQNEYGPAVVAELYTFFVTMGRTGDTFALSGAALIKNYVFTTKQWE